MQAHTVVSRAEWFSARKQHLAKEKGFTYLRDQLSQERRDLPWVKVDKTYIFDGPDGEESLSEVFAGRSQLLVYRWPPRSAAPPPSGARGTRPWRMPSSRPLGRQSYGNRCR